MRFATPHQDDTHTGSDELGHSSGSILAPVLDKRICSDRERDAMLASIWSCVRPSGAQRLPLAIAGCVLASSCAPATKACDSQLSCNLSEHTISLN
jgi:hypothetical protein